jgi:hypothetical protein
MESTVFVSQTRGRISWNGSRSLVIRISFEFHEHLGEGGVQWCPLVISEILFYLLVFFGTGVLYRLRILLLLGLLGGWLLLLLGVIEKGSERFFLIDVPVHLYHKGMKIFRWFQRQFCHQRSILLQALEDCSIDEIIWRTLCIQLLLVESP